MNTGKSFKALLAVAVQDYGKACEIYTEALVECGVQHASVYGGRSSVRLLMGDYKGALEDADAAVKLDCKSPANFLLQGHALFSLKEYKKAKAAFEIGAGLGSEATFVPWIAMCNAAYEGEEDPDDSERNIFGGDSDAVDGLVLLQEVPKDFGGTMLFVKCLSSTDVTRQLFMPRAESEKLYEEIANLNIPFEGFTVDFHFGGKVDSVPLVLRKDNCFTLNWRTMLGDRKSLLKVGLEIAIRYLWVGDRLHLFMVEAGNQG